MSRQTVYAEMKRGLGVVPTFFKSVPDKTLEDEWRLFLKVQNEPGAIPNKYRELIGLAVAAVTKCGYCRFFHTEMAKLHGATRAEIEDAVHYAKSSIGWSAYITGMSTDMNQFQREVRAACAHIKKQAGKGRRASKR
jgi:AhpD family alkylhydroperoxidase